MNLKGMYNWKINLNGKLPRIRVLNSKDTILKQINISFIVHFWLGKYSFSFLSFFYTPCKLYLTLNKVY